LATASALSVNSRTCGFPFWAAGALPRPGQWLLIVLMLIGAAPGGAGGGLKVTALFHFFRGTRGALRRETGRRVTGIIAVWIATYAGLVLLTLLGLLASLPDMPGDRLLFLAASAVGNVGLSHDPVSVADVGLMVVSLAMLIGRFAPLAVLWWIARTTSDADVV
jgi:trk system potassium uptake protein TrkH